MTAGSGRRRLIVAGSIAQRPHAGGHTWVFLQYALGFRELGFDVLLLDRLEPDMCTDAQGAPCTPEDSENVRYLEAVVGDFGLERSWALLLDGGPQKGRSSLGLSRPEVLRWAADSELLLNVNGFIDDEELLSAARLRAFLDIDPGFGQMWRELGLHDPFVGHDAYVTVGEGIGQPWCEIPTGGIDWITTSQPVVLSQWPAVEGEGRAYTSVASWRGPTGPVDYHGKRYGLRVHEFRRFAELPRLVNEPLELALDIHPDESADLQLLRENGWALVDPVEAAGDPDAYRRYVQGSKAELMVAKGMYVQSRSGWFSDRSICYLASGRPVLAQETGFSRLHPVGEGLLSFTTLEEAVAGVEEIAGEHRRHARAARALAEQRFDSRRVLGRLLERLGVA